MIRSNYSFDIDDNWKIIRWRGAVNSAIKGRRGQKLLNELLESLDAMPEKILIADEFEKDGNYCALGILGKKRALDLSSIDPENTEQVAEFFGIAEALVSEIFYINDDHGNYNETNKQRWFRVRNWVYFNINNAGLVA
jgi:hypothetical protein